VVNLTKLLVIAGPTASGKTKLSVELALRLGAEIISADSVQVYKGMDIGSAKPKKAELKGVRCHLIDVVTPDVDYNVANYVRDAEAAIDDITKRGKRVIVTGGTGLYIRALLHGLFEGPPRDTELRKGLIKEAEEKGREALYERLRAVDPAAAASMHSNNISRVVRALEVYLLSGRPISKFQKEHGFKEEKHPHLVVGLVKERAILYKDIETRVDEMIQSGLEKEVRGLLDNGYAPSLKSMSTLGYKEMASYVNDGLTREEAVELIKKNTRNYAKRQLTWFKKVPGIVWMEPVAVDKIDAMAAEFFAKGS